MIRYTELGLSNTKEMFRKAMEGGYAVPAYNFNNLEQLQAIINGCIESKSPVILQVSKGARSTRTRRCCGTSHRAPCSS